MVWRYLIIYYFFRIMEIRFILILIMRDVIILFIPNKCFNQILFTDESETIKKIFLYSNIIKKKIKILKKMKKITPL